jgi:hypothetical protein
VAGKEHVEYLLELGTCERGLEAAVKWVSVTWLKINHTHSRETAVSLRI